MITIAPQNQLSVFLDSSSRGGQGFLSSGNRCGHNPLFPRLFVAPNSHKPRPLVLEDAKTSLQSFYHKPENYLKSIKYSRNSTKQQRSEAREAILAVGQVILHYLHLPTMQIGLQDNSGEFKHLSNRFIYEKAKIDRRRFDRAIQSLTTAGYIKITRRFKFDKDRIIQNITSIKKVSHRFFVDLGISELKLNRGVEYAKKRFYDAVSAVETYSKSMVSLLSNMLSTRRAIRKTELTSQARKKDTKVI